MNIRAPAKLILSGEHAVVHGAPALAIAVNYYTTVKITRLPYPLFTLALQDFDYKQSLDAYALNEVSEHIQEQFKLFQQGHCPIQDVVQQPHELIEYALSVIVKNYHINQGMTLHLASDIPVGCGMGSSAAAIVSSIYAVTACAGFNLSPDELYPLALTVENMQHGYSSGMDVQLSLRGGCLYRQGNMLESRHMVNLSLHLVNTGAPKVSTGQCVSAARVHFNGEKNNLIDDFKSVTHAMDQAWQASSHTKMAEAIRANHQLLVQIGVVPDRVQSFIADLDKCGAAAKICGAGAISGDNAGVVLVLTPNLASLTAICQHYGYQHSPVIGETRGVHEF